MSGFPPEKDWPDEPGLPNPEPAPRWSPLPVEVRRALALTAVILLSGYVLKIADTLGALLRSRMGGLH